MSNEEIRMMYDVLVIGGGPAGLSAALMLARCRYRVLVCDAGEPRNRFTNAVHGFFTRDGVSPKELLNIGTEQLRKYGVEILKESIVTATRAESGYLVRSTTGRELESRKLILATGVKDELPPLPGIEKFYGKSVHHCPYCDGWERRDQALAVYGKGKSGAGLALSLKAWSEDIVLCTNGSSELSENHKAKLVQKNIPIIETPIAELEGEGEDLRGIRFSDAQRIEREAMFCIMQSRPNSELLAQLGCTLNEKGVATTDCLERSNLPGVFIVGDVSEDVQLVVSAAAEGAKAGFAASKELQKEAGLAVE
jgi:thioredoxin reductase